MIRLAVFSLSTFAAIIFMHYLEFNNPRKPFTRVRIGRYRVMLLKQHVPHDSLKTDSRSFGFISVRGVVLNPDHKVVLTGGWGAVSNQNSLGSVNSAVKTVNYSPHPC